MVEEKQNIALIKSILLAKSTIKLIYGANDNIVLQNGNLHQSNWIFLRLSETSRVRLQYEENANLLLQPSQNGMYHILDAMTNQIITCNVQIENALVHAPEQLFFTIYKKCIAGCKFCPLSTRKDDSHYSFDLIYSRIKSIDQTKIKSIGLASSAPPSLSTSDIVDELIFIIEKIRRMLKLDMPIGVSIKTPSKEDLRKLKAHGVHEVRLNLETYNDHLSQELMPFKKKEKILCSIRDACDIFGDGFVSSNMLVGIGESDEDLLSGIEALAQMGAVATLYPYDPIKNGQETFVRPSAERLYNLALEHKKIFERYHISPYKLQTMCCACAASHIYPGKDI